MQGVGLKRIRDRRLKNVQCPVDQLVLRLALESHLLGLTFLGAEKDSYTAITFRRIVGEAVGGLERGPPTGVCMNTSGDGVVHTRLVGSCRLNGPHRFSPGCVE